MALVSETASKGGRAIRLHGRRVTEEELHKFVLGIVSKGITKTSEIAPLIGKTEKQTKRILNKMAELGRIQVDPNTNRLVKTTEQRKIEEYRALSQGDFAQLEEIDYYIKQCRQRGIKPKVLYHYILSLNQIFTLMETRPRSILPQVDDPEAPTTFGSRTTAIKFSQNLTLKVQEAYGLPEPRQDWRVSLRNLYDVYGLSFGHGMARQYGLGSHHTRFKPYAGAHIPLATCEKILNDMLAKNDLEAYTWFNIGIMTGPRSSALATMVWSRVNLDENDFYLQQHETKDDSVKHRGKDLHLGELGEWHTVNPPKKLLQILLEWKQKAPKNSPFLWFEDCGSDELNRKAARKFRDSVIPRLRRYIMKHKQDLDAVTLECIEKGGKSGHLLRHTYAQLQAEYGLTKTQIAEGKWKSEDTVGWYAAATKADREKKRSVLEAIHSEKPESNNEVKAE